MESIADIVYYLLEKDYKERKEVPIPAATKDAIANSIKNRWLLNIYYEGDAENAPGRRWIEPYVWGLHKRTNNNVLRAWQYKGKTTSIQPGWKMFRLDRTRNTAPLTTEHFDKPRPLYHPDDLQMSKIIERVTFGDQPGADQDKGEPKTTTPDGMKADVEDLRKVSNDPDIGTDGIEQALDVVQQIENDPKLQTNPDLEKTSDDIKKAAPEAKTKRPIRDFLKRLIKKLLDQLSRLLKESINAKLGKSLLTEDASFAFNGKKLKLHLEPTINPTDDGVHIQFVVDHAEDVSSSDLGTFTTSLQTILNESLSPYGMSLSADSSSEPQVIGYHLTIEQFESFVKKALTEVLKTSKPKPNEKTEER